MLYMAFTILDFIECTMVKPILDYMMYMILTVIYQRY